MCRLSAEKRSSLFCFSAVEFMDPGGDSNYVVAYDEIQERILMAYKRLLYPEVVSSNQKDESESVRPTGNLSSPSGSGPLPVMVPGSQSPPPVRLTQLLKEEYERDNDRIQQLEARISELELVNARYSAELKELHDDHRRNIESKDAEISELRKKMSEYENEKIFVNNDENLKIEIYKKQIKNLNLELDKIRRGDQDTI
jgi:hypothetical protein